MNQDRTITGTAWITAGCLLFFQLIHAEQGSKLFNVEILHAHAMPITAPVLDENGRTYFVILRSAARSSTLDQGFISSQGTTGQTLKFAGVGEPLDLAWDHGDLSAFRLSLGIPVCAIIGNDWLSRFSLEFDLDAGAMSAFPNNAERLLSDRFDEKEPLANGPAAPPSRFFKIAGYAVKALLDTGADDEFVIPTTEFNKLLREGALGDVSSVQGGGVNGVHEIRVGVLTTPSATGGLPLKTFVAETRATAASVGMGLLQHRNFCIDRYSNALWTRERHAPVPPNDGFTEIGLALIFPPNVGPTVFQVVEGSPAAVAGIATGDMILELSGLPSEAINRYTAEKALSKAATERNQFEILISRGGNTVELTVIPTVATKL